jgi:hypothetical protein
MHCETNKHKRNLLVKNVTFTNVCEVCNKSYISSEDEHTHVDCKPTEINPNVDMSQLVYQLIQQNQQLIDIISNKLNDS